MHSHHFDIIIIGGGVVGLALAGMLAHNDLSIAVIDHQLPPDMILKTPYDLRVASINHASQAIFQCISVWDKMTELRVSPYRKMKVWDLNSPARIHFDATEIKQPYLGHIIELSVIRQVLWQFLSQKNNVTLYHSTSPTDLLEDQNHISVSLNNDQILNSSLLIGADGKDSWVAKKAGFSAKIQSHDQSALVTTVRTKKPHQYTALQRFLSQGPLAFLPLLDQHLSSIVWSTTTEQAYIFQTLEEKTFNQILTSAIESELGDVEIIDRRIVFPLFQSHTHNYVKSRVALVGDAIHTLYPLAGQGVNVGLLDAACLAEIIENCLNSKRDFGEFHHLRRYERWRKGENTAIIAAMSGFHHLFTNSFELTKYARYLGFSVANKISPIKRYFMERAMGLRGELPTKVQQYLC